MAKILPCKRASLVHRVLWDQNGSATIEFVMMVPVFTALLLIIADASLLYTKQAMLMDVARDTARIVSRHALTAEEAELHAVRVASTTTSPAMADVAIVDGTVTVTLETDASAAAAFGIIKFAIGDKISTTAIVVMEPV